MNCAKHISVSIVIEIIDRFGFSSIEMTPSNVGIDKNEILEKAKGYIELFLNNREEAYRGFKQKQKKESEHERNNYHD
mgnify:CR=1 FL=1